MAEDESDLVVKHREGDRDVAALQAEAELLRFAAHPGVVEMVRSEASAAAGWELTVRRVPGADLTGVGPWTADEVAGYGAAVATTLADLHDVGVVHGRLAPEHLLVDLVGRPVICGFGHARRCLGEPAADAWKAADVADLARCLAARTPAGSPRALDRAIDRAITAKRRPMSARQLAALLGRATSAPTLPGPSTPGPSTPGPSTPSSSTPGPSTPGSGDETSPSPTAAPGGAIRLYHWRPGRRQAALGGVFLAAAAVTVVLTLGPLLFRSPVVRGGRGPLPPSQSSAVRASSALPCPAVDDGCGPLPSPGGVVALARGRFRIGRPGDVVVLGRWTCTTTALAALLRPSNGAVWVFWRWAHVGGRATATLLARVVGARSLRVLPEAGGCDRVEVLRRSGPPVVLPWPSGPARPGHGGEGR